MLTPVANAKSLTTLLSRRVKWCLVIFTMLAIAASASADRPSASEYVATQCVAYAAAYDPLVEHYLSQFRGGFSTSEILQMPAIYNGTRLQREFKGALPVLYILDGEVYRDSSLPQPGGKRLKNLEFFGIPLLQQLGQLAVLPDMALRYSPFDEPVPFTGVDAAPWFGYCSVPQQQRILMLPDTIRKANLRCSETCRAGSGDTRIPKAVFLGTPTGWKKGKRKAVLRAGLEHPERVYAGLTGDPEGLLTAEEASEYQLQPPLPLHEQVALYKYIVNVEGNCAALRLKQLLAGPSAVFFVQSDEIEWFYPLLTPFVHYIPVSFRWAGVRKAFQVDLAAKVAWAEDNPHRVAEIVKEANIFASHFLSRQGQECFAMQLLDKYSRMINGVRQLRTVRNHSKHVGLPADVNVSTPTAFWEMQST